MRCLLSLLLTLSLHGVCWAGASYNFDENADYFSCGSDTSIDNGGSSAFTIMAWIQADDMGESQLARVTDKTNTLFLVRTNAGAPASTNAVCISIVTSGTQMTKCSADNTVNVSGDWTHVAATYDGGGVLASDFTVYINGAISATTGSDGTGSYSSDAAATLFIGSNSANTRDFDGGIAYVQYWVGRQLSVTEINEAMWHPGSITDVDLYQPMLADGVDLSPTGVNDCTITGATISSDGPPVYLSSPLAKVWNRLMRYVLLEGWPFRRNYTRWG